MSTLHITDLESAINWWRERCPSDGISACAEVRALAEPYAQMVWQGLHDIEPSALSAAAMVAWLAWYASTPDAPCIAICSTAQGDALCKGCGRTEQEVQHWPQLSPLEKRQVWHRINTEGTAWRYNRYAERARPSGATGSPAG